VSKSIRHVALSVLSLSLLSVNPATAQYKRRDLVSNISGRALRKDSNLINGWGLAFFQHSPFWVADTGTGLSSLYGPEGAAVPLVVTVPPAPSQPFGPDGLSRILWACSILISSAGPVGSIFPRIRDFPLAVSFRL
jgi:hypothetical protein